MSIRYYPTQNPLRPGTWRAVLLSGGRASLDAFLDHCATASTVGRADALATIEMMARWIEVHAADGREVDFGPLGHTRLGLGGEFAAEEAAIRPDQWRLTIGWEVAPRLQRRVAQVARNAGLQRRPPPHRGPNLVQVVDLMTGRRDGYSPGGLLELTGARLKLDPARGDEGIFFCPAAGGAEARADRYVEVFPKRILAVVPAALTGPQRLIVRARPRPSQPAPAECAYAATLAPAPPGP